jgi:SAM-dependent methyltransferase
MSAFVKAMFDQLRQPNRNVTFHMRVVGGYGMDCPCQDFIRLRSEEESLIGQSLDGRQRPRLLDIGCGIGRHSAFIQSKRPDAQIMVVEIDQELREHTRSNIARATAYEQFSDVPAEARFDIILLMGNGLGVFGSENPTRDALARVRGMVAEGGCVLIESGTFKPGEFHAVLHEIEYNGVIDDPFIWGYATRDWLARELENVGFTGVSITQSSRGGSFFIIYAKII